jgi:hypothetical protein
MVGLLFVLLLVPATAARAQTAPASAQVRAPQPPPVGAAQPMVTQDYVVGPQDELNIIVMANRRR